MGRHKTDKPAVIVEDEHPLDEADEDFDDDDADDAPCVVLGQLSDLRGFGDPGLLRKYGDRPIWFMIQDDADFMTLFDKHPERPGVWGEGRQRRPEAPKVEPGVWGEGRQRRPEAPKVEPLPPALSRSIMDVLRAFAASESDALQTVLGSTDAIEFGFHERASVDDVAEAFEDDGFDVAFVLQDGKVVTEVDDED